MQHWMSITYCSGPSELHLKLHPGCGALSLLSAAVEHPAWESPVQGLLPQSSLPALGKWLRCLCFAGGLLSGLEGTSAAELSRIMQWSVVCSDCMNNIAVLANYQIPYLLVAVSAWRIMQHRQFMTWATSGIVEAMLHLLKELACKDCKTTLHFQQTARNRLKSCLVFILTFPSNRFNCWLPTRQHLSDGASQCRHSMAIDKAESSRWSITVQTLHGYRQGSTYQMMHHCEDTPPHITIPAVEALSCYLLTLLPSAA